MPWTSQRCPACQWWHFEEKCTDYAKGCASRQGEVEGWQELYHYAMDVIRAMDAGLSLPLWPEWQREHAAK